MLHGIGATTADKLEGTSCGVDVDPLLFPPPFPLTLYAVLLFYTLLPYTFPLKSN